MREQNDFGYSPPFTPELLQRVGAMRLPLLRYRTNKLLKVIVSEHLSVDDVVNLSSITSDERIQGITYSLDRQSVRNLVEILLVDGLVSPFEKQMIAGVSAVTAISPTAKGFLAIEELAMAGSDSAQGFVAMSFSGELRDAWHNGFEPAIRAAGFRPMRIDAKDYTGGVMDEIIAEIRRSRFVVADCTQQRNGVYFEAGFAAGLGLTLIPTCRSDDMKNRHFDIQHLNTLEWQMPADLMRLLPRRIIAAIGPGPDLRPP